MYLNLLKSVKDSAFSQDPFTFLANGAQNDMATCFEIHLLENGSRAAREKWQQIQLFNLLKFAYSNSSFWKRRLPGKFENKNFLEHIPILSRDELNVQIKTEGALVKLAGDEVSSYASSGSTGTPVKVYCLPQNERYNTLRSIAQYFIENRDLNCNRTFIKPADGLKILSSDQKMVVEHYDSWVGNFSHVFEHGAYKIIYFNGDKQGLIQELLKSPVGYLACLGSHMDILLEEGGNDLIQKLQIKMWLHHSDTFDPKHREILSQLNIPIRSNYSCAELGPIAVECDKSPGYYHVTHSNVMVEADTLDTLTIGDEVLSKLLITHLHSYATPLIRYDVGDYGKLYLTCACGHEGVTLSHIHGRKKFFVKNTMGKLIAFPIFSKPLSDIISFTEFFIFQDNLEIINVELGGREKITTEEKLKVTQFIKRLVGEEFNVNVIGLDKIDWSKNPKRLPFIRYVE